MMNDFASFFKSAKMKSQHFTKPSSITLGSYEIKEQTVVEAIARPIFEPICPPSLKTARY